jgi:hypothetical protein
MRGLSTAKVDFGGQEQPERLRRNVGRARTDRGDTVVCESAPKALLKLWNLLETCD